MTQFPPGPYVFEIPYTIEGFSHKLQVHCDVIGEVSPGDAPVDIEMRTKGDGPIGLDASANAFWTVVRPLFSTTTTASVFSLWKTNELNSDWDFISGGSLSVPNGSNVAAPVKAQQGIFTLRSAGGHIGKLQFMETPVASNARGPLGSITGEAITIRNWVLSDASFVCARDRSFLIAPLNESWSQNEALSRKRFRQ